MTRGRPPSTPKDKIEVTMERRLVWTVDIEGQVRGRPVRGSATAPNLRMVGFIIGGLQRATPSVPVKVHWISERPRRPRRGGRR